MKFQPFLSNLARLTLVSAVALTSLVVMLPAQAQSPNLALNKPVTCSPTPEYACANAVDGNVGTRWSSAHQIDPQFIYVDLGATTSISHVILRWEAAYGKSYQIQTSNDATNWTNIYTTTTGDGGVDDLTGLSGSGRYVRMNGTVRALPLYGYSLFEFEIYGGSSATNTPTNTSVGATNTPTNTQAVGCNATNIAQGKPATASSVLGGNTAAMAVDGNGGTRWESVHGVDPQWIYVDLGATQSICRVRLNWEPAYGKSYQIQTSNDASAWTNIYTTTTGDGGIDDLTNLAGSGRYVRMNGTVRATIYGYSLWEFEIYIQGLPPTPSNTSTPTNTTVATNTPTNTVPPPTAGTPTRTNTPVATNTPTNTSVPGGDIVLSYAKPATASSQQNDANCSGCTPDKAFDMITYTRWATAWADPQWIYVDLSATATIHRVYIKWEAAFGKAYQIQTSPDATNWTTIYTTTTGDGGIDDLTGLNGTGRYVRLYATVRGTAWGYSLWDMDVYGTGGAPNPTPTPAPTATPMTFNTLVWSDEFNAASLNTTNWTLEVGGGGFGNGELEYYTNGQNLTFTGAEMIIHARKENPNNYQCWYGTCTYTSSRLKSQGLREFTYGRLEARLQIPYSQGLWPAFWMLGNDIGGVGWPTSGEIDIMENIGKEPSIVHGTLHGPGYSGCCGIGGGYTLPSGQLHDAYHVYRVEWESTGFRWYIDNTLYFTVPRATVEARGPWVFSHPFFFLLNVAVGGAWPGSPDATSVFPQQMKVDYVRVYQ